MIIILGDHNFTDQQQQSLLRDWPEELILHCCSPRAAAGFCEGIRPPHVLIVNETGLSLMENAPCLHDTANICLAGGSFKYRPKGLKEPDNLMGVNSMNEAIEHALGRPEHSIVPSA